MASTKSTTVICRNWEEYRTHNSVVKKWFYDTTPCKIQISYKTRPGFAIYELNTRVWVISKSYLCNTNRYLHLWIYYILTGYSISSMRISVDSFKITVDLSSRYFHRDNYAYWFLDIREQGWERIRRFLCTLRIIHELRPIWKINNLHPRVFIINRPRISYYNVIKTANTI